MVKWWARLSGFEAASWHLLQHFLSSTFASDFGWKMVLLTHFQSPTDTSFIVWRNIMAIISDDILQGLVLLCLQLTSASAPLSLFGDYHDEVLNTTKILTYYKWVAHIKLNVAFSHYIVFPALCEPPACMTIWHVQTVFANRYSWVDLGPGWRCGCYLWGWAACIISFLWRFFLPIHGVQVPSWPGGWSKEPGGIRAPVWTGNNRHALSSKFTNMNYIHI